MGENRITNANKTKKKKKFPIRIGSSRLCGFFSLLVQYAGLTAVNTFLCVAGTGHGRRFFFFFFFKCLSIKTDVSSAGGCNLRSCRLGSFLVLIPKSPASRLHNAQSRPSYPPPKTLKKKRKKKTKEDSFFFLFFFFHFFMAQFCRRKKKREKTR